jgi:hypothetical protein
VHLRQAPGREQQPLRPVQPGEGRRRGGPAARRHRLASAARPVPPGWALPASRAAGRPARRRDADRCRLRRRLHRDHVRSGTGTGRQTIPATPEHLHYTVREPFAVQARIVPYNHPLFFSASKLAPPLVAGNAVILKAPDQAPLPALRIGELAQEALPPGLVSVVSGRARRPAARWCSIRGSGALPSSVRSDRQVGPAGRGGRRGQGRVGGAGREERDDRLRRRRSRRPGCRGRLPG